eukprot:92452_1
MYVTWQLGPLLIIIQVCLSAIASVYSEWLYKTYGKSRSICIDNLFMYFWGIISNLLQFACVINNEQSVFSGFNHWTWVLVIMYTVLGLCSGQIMKHLDNMVKVYITSLSLVCGGILTWFIFGIHWTYSYVIGTMVVIFSVSLFMRQIIIKQKHLIFVMLMTIMFSIGFLFDCNSNLLQFIWSDDEFQAVYVNESNIQVYVDFVSLNKWIYNHPDGIHFDSVDFFRRRSFETRNKRDKRVFDSIMRSWEERDMTKYKDVNILAQLEKHCLQPWKRLIQKEFIKQSKNAFVGEYMLKQGSKIGALRHFDVIPWDDDFDVLIYIDHIKYQEYVLKLFDEIPEHTYYGKCSMVYKPCGHGKLFFNNTKITHPVEGFGNKNTKIWNTTFTHLKSGEIRYPYIDWFFGYSDGKENILFSNCSAIEGVSNKFASTKINDTFPVQYLVINDKYYPFEKNVLYKMSRNISEYGEKDPIKNCIVLKSDCSHRKETSMTLFSNPMDCKYFWNNFTFVRIDEYIKEHNFKNISWIKFDQNNQWPSNLTFVNLRVSFDKNNSFHRAYMFLMLNDNTFQTVNITQNIHGIGAFDRTELMHSTHSYVDSKDIKNNENKSKLNSKTGNTIFLSPETKDINNNLFTRNKNKNKKTKKIKISPEEKNKHRKKKRRKKISREKKNKHRKKKKN